MKAEAAGKVLRRARGDEPQPPRWLTSLILLAVPAIALWPLTSARFLTWDDLATLYANPRMNPASWAGALHFWRHPYMDLFVPLTYSVWSLLALLPRLPAPALDGSTLDPMWFHGANLALHLLSGLVVLGILRRVLRREWPALAGALVFALHPVQVESVAWASGLKDVLAGLLGLTALSCYLRMLDGDRHAGGSAASRASSASRTATRWFAAATACFLLALIAKPSAVMIPVLALVLDRAVTGRPWRAALRRLAPWLLVAASWAVVARLVQPGYPESRTALWARPFLAGDALAFYLGKLFVPLHLATDYGRMPRVVLSDWVGYATWIVPAAVGLACWLGRRALPLLGTGALVLVAAVFPVLGFLTFDFQRYSGVADHYLYVAMLGPAIAVGAALVRWPGQRVGAVMVAILLLLALQSRAQTSHWQDNAVFNANILRVNPDSFLAHTNFGCQLASAGKPAEAVPHFLEAVRINADFRDAHFHLARARNELGDRQAAIAEYREALRIDPKYAEARHNLAGLLAEEGQLDVAIAELQRVVAEVPEYTLAHCNLGALLQRAGRDDEAAREYREALRQQPGFERAQRALATLEHR